jgi:ABC-type uncharacterized transport system involved in gliding motility auxiliary subunit
MPTPRRKVELIVFARASSLTVSAAPSWHVSLGSSRQPSLRATPPTPRKKRSRKKQKKEEGEEKAEDPEEKKADFLKESTTPGRVLLIADVDFVYDANVVRRNQVPGLNIVIPEMLNENLTLVQNAAEQMSGDPDLIKVRSRTTVRRPFTRQSEWYREAQEKYAEEVKDFREKAKGAETRPERDPVTDTRKYRPGTSLSRGAGGNEKAPRRGNPVPQA